MKVDQLPFAQQPVSATKSPAVDQPSGPALPVKILEIARSLMESRGGLGYCESLGLPSMVADHDEKWIVFDRSGKPTLVVMLASTPFPDVVREASSRAAQARRVLGQAAGAHVVVPLHASEFDGRSFAITPYMRPVARHGLVARWHRWRLRRPIFSWLREVTLTTAKTPNANEVVTDFSDPLHHLADSDFLPDKVRCEARVALDELEAGRWKPMQVTAHNDLWSGNLLRTPSGAGAAPGFAVIDWGASRSEGHAVYDLVRLAMSFQLPRAEFREELSAHARILGCDVTQMRHHLVSALAYLGDHRGEWPAERFAEMAKACVDYVESASPAPLQRFSERRPVGSVPSGERWCKRVPRTGTDSV